MTLPNSQIRLIAPSWIFISATFVFSLVPNFIVAYTEYEPRVLLTSLESFKDAASLYFLVNTFFFIFFVSNLVMLSRLRYRRSIDYDHDTSSLRLLQRRFDLFAALFSIVSIGFVSLYAFNGGFSKLALLGSEMESREFRFLNFNEVPRVYTALLQIARRFIIPLIVVYLSACWAFGVKRRPILLSSLIMVQLFASALTFARAPFLTLVVSLVLVRLVTARNAYRVMLELAVAIFLIGATAGVTTFLQYNITDFSLEDVWRTGIDFLVNRTWLVPSVVPVNLVFSEFRFNSDFLFLEYSRLGGLLGYEVVGTLQKDSHYVAPVGHVADIWRNFGPVGVITFSVLFAMLFHWIDSEARKLNVFFALIYAFLCVAATFYLLMGVLFSQGAVFSIFLLLFFPFFAKKVRPSHRGASK